MNNQWIIDKTGGIIKHTSNGLVLEIENGEVINIAQMPSTIKLGSLPSLIKDALVAYKKYNNRARDPTNKNSNRPVLSLKKKDRYL